MLFEMQWNSNKKDKQNFSNAKSMKNKWRYIVICVYPNTKNIFSFNLDIYTKMKHFKVILKIYL